MTLEDTIRAIRAGRTVDISHLQDGDLQQAQQAQERARLSLQSLSQFERATGSWDHVKDGIKGGKRRW